MRVFSDRGSVFFQLGEIEKNLLPKSFFEKKKHVQRGENKFWIYATDWPSLLTYNDTVLGVQVKRDFFSPVKEEIFAELGIFEREEGIFSLESYAGKSLSPVLSGSNFYTCKGFVQLGDRVSGKKISALNGFFDIETGFWEGNFDVL